MDCRKTESSNIDVIFREASEGKNMLDLRELRRSECQRMSEVETSKSTRRRRGSLESFDPEDTRHAERRSSRDELRIEGDRERKEESVKKVSR